MMKLEWEDVELNIASIWEEYAYIDIAVGQLMGSDHRIDRGNSLFGERTV